VHTDGGGDQSALATLLLAQLLPRFGDRTAVLSHRGNGAGLPSVVADARGQLVESVEQAMSERSTRH
jgi:hypothetical protein